MGKLSLISILKEEKQHLDDEIVDYNEINLQKEFDKLNSLLFSNKIKPVTMEWNRRKTAHGHVKATINRITKEINIKVLSLSKFLDIPYKFFKDVLAHELIHVYLLQKGLNVNHGKEFVDEMNRINSMGLGFNVTITGDGSKFEVSQQSSRPALELVFGLFNLNGKKAVSVMNYTTYKREAKKISKIFSGAIRSGKYKEVTGEFYLSKSPSLQRETIQRSFSRSLSYNVNLTDEQINQYKANAKLLGSFNCNTIDCNWNGDDIPDEPQPVQRIVRRNKFDRYGLFN